MVVAMGATSCRKDDKGIAGDRMTIGANIGQHDGDGAKTVIGDETDDQFPILWSEGDAFALYSKTSTSGSPFAITSGIGSESGLFEGANPGDAPYFASYPAEVTRMGETTFAYEIPQDQTGLNHAGPMVGYSADGKSVSFDNAMSWVRIGLKGEAKVTKVEMSYSEAKGTPVPLSGTLTITVDGNGGITSTSVAANRKAEAQKLHKDCDVTLTADNAYFDFLVPAGAFGGSTEAKFKVFGTDDVQLATFNKTMPEIERNKVYVGVFETPINDAPATPKFTVGDGTTVEFAPGNLYWDGSSWQFEANQWDFRTYEGKNSCIAGSVKTDGTPNGHWGLFGWSTSATTYGMSTSKDNSDYSGDFKDWGGLAIGDYAANTWHTLSNAEWGYLLYTRDDDASSLWARVTLSDVSVSGLVILPDGTENPSTVLASITETADLATYGAVFLPATGYRYGTGVYFGGSYGDYWSGTPLEEGSAYSMYFDSGDPVVLSDDRGYGDAVRLVR